MTIKKTKVKAKKPTKSTSKTRQTPRPKLQWLLSVEQTKAMNKVLVIITVLVALFLLISLFSYHASDPGRNNISTSPVIHNWGGSLGAYMADTLFDAFGQMAYLLVGLLLGFAYKLVRFPVKTNLQLSLGSLLLPFVGFIFTLTGACVLNHLYFNNPLGKPYVAGGILGDLVSQGFRPKVGIVGVSVLALVLFITGVSLVTKLSWLQLMDSVGKAAEDTVISAKTKWARLKDRYHGAKAKKRSVATVKAIEKTIALKKPPIIEPKIVAPKVSKRVHQERQMPLIPAAEGNTIPSLTLLDPVEEAVDGFSDSDLQKMSLLLIKKLHDFKITATIESVQPGPVITRFEIEPAAGIKASQIVGLSRDLARALSVQSIRVVENIPGKPYMGIEIPNPRREIVQLLSVLSSEVYNKAKAPLTVVLGKDIAGAPVVTDLAKAPHILVAGTTGSGKSVCINTLIMSIVYKNTPEEVRMIMVDPKMLELSVYEDIPHLLAPVVTDMSKASNALHWCIAEMDRRFTIMAKLGVRNIAGYMTKLEKARAEGNPLKDPFFEPDISFPQDAPELQNMPYIVVIVDELADLMMVTKKKIEEVIIRIAQRARAAGIHLVLATQRPSVDVVTGLIKANVPSRIAFQVSTRHDSRTVLDAMGAEQLLGMGDMLFMPPGVGYLERVHGAFVSDDEVKKVADHLRASGAPQYIDEITDGIPEASPDGGTYGDDEMNDELYDKAIFFVTKERKCSISSIQRYLRVGYNRSARMVETMEQQGIVGPLSHGKREVLAPPPPDLD